MSGGSIASMTMSGSSSIVGSPGVSASAMPATTSRIGNGKCVRWAIQATAATTASNAATVYRASGTGKERGPGERRMLPAPPRRPRPTSGRIASFRQCSKAAHASGGACVHRPLRKRCELLLLRALADRFDRLAPLVLRVDAQAIRHVVFVDVAHVRCRLQADLFADDDLDIVEPFVRIESALRRLLAH